MATRATPAVRAVAARRGIDLTTVTGTGAGGRITVNDVRNAATRRNRATVAQRRERENAEFEALFGRP